MENEDGGMHLWDGQGIVNFQPKNLTHTTITKRSQREKVCARIVHIKGKQWAWKYESVPNQTSFTSSEETFYGEPQLTK